MAATIIQATARYYGPTDTRGSRIVVKWTDDSGKKRQRSHGYSHAARDAYTFAVAETFGLAEDTRVLYNVKGATRHYTVRIN